MADERTEPQDYLAQVRAHYEVLPYPWRDPEKERDDFFVFDGASLDAFNHFGYGGQRDLRKGVRVLIAGEGTGDPTIFLAEQFRDTNVEITAIDISTASLALAKARLAKRGLTNVTHHHLSILDLPQAGLGKFDLIECSGVLHHLADPDAGLAALASVLADDGIMALMVYAQYGRMSVYLVQALMKQLMADAMPAELKIKIAREFLGNIPRSHWMSVNNAQFLPEIRWPDGSGIYDLFLHSTDRAYTVPQIYDWLAGAGLYHGQFFGDFAGMAAYRPETYTGSPLLNLLSKDKPAPEREAIAELMHGGMTKHHFYATKQPKIPAQFADDMVITLSFRQWMFGDFLPSLQKELRKVKPGETIEKSGHPMPEAPPMFITKGQYTETLLGLIDGVRCIGEIVTETAKQKQAEPALVRAELERLYQEMHRNQRVYLRHKDIAPYTKPMEINERLKSIQPIA